MQVVDSTEMGHVRNTLWRSNLMEPSVATQMKMKAFIDQYNHGLPKKRTIGNFQHEKRLMEALNVADQSTHSVYALISCSKWRNPKFNTCTVPRWTCAKPCLVRRANTLDRIPSKLLDRLSGYQTLALLRCWIGRIWRCQLPQSRKRSRVDDSA